MRTVQDTKGELLNKIRNRTAKVGVIGLGYVGLPFAVEKAKVGFTVVGIDGNAKRVAKVNAGENYISDVNDAELKQLVTVDKRITATTDWDVVPELDILVIAVPTPLTRNLTPDLQFVERVTAEVGKRIRPGQLVSLESTTYPGTTEQVMLPKLMASGLEPEKDFFLAHSPERVDPGNKRYTTKNTSKVVGGLGPHSLEVAAAFYGETISHVVPVSNASAAEMTKVFENTFRAVNIALVNELAMLCDRMGLNVWEVLDAAFTKPFGIMPFYPGPGVGGHCIPLDPHYLEWKAKELNFETRFITLAGEINRRMPAFVCEKAFRLLNKLGKAPSQSKVGILGVAYKRDLSDWRESPAMGVIKHLREMNCAVSYHDPFVPEFEEHDLAMASVPLTKEWLEENDLTIIVTDHTTIDYRWVAENAKALLDTRNATKTLPVESRKRVTLL
jgi:nucleotide sugar dehydrogenase